MNSMADPQREALEVLTSLETYLKAQKRSGMKLLYRGTLEAGGAAEPTVDLPERERKEALLKKVRRELGECKRCRLHAGRKNIVFGEGNPCARLVFVGEAPGADEDLQARPFVGKAGRLLTRIIQAIDLQRSDVYIANVVKCRPPSNRNPEEVETKTCMPFLKQQLEIIQPRIICTLGRVATAALLQTSQGITELRGTFRMYDDSKVMPTYHPSYLLRNPSAKKETWQDMQLVQKEYFQEINVIVDK